MAHFHLPRTTAVAGSSVSIIDTDHPTVSDGQEWEVFATDNDIWVNVAGGTASADGDNCIPVPAGTAVVITIADGVTDLKAIQDSAAGNATVSLLKG